jgi:hypothetical protein
MGDRRVSDRGMVARIAGEPPAQGVLTELVDLLGGESEGSRRFLGGIIAGALVGAAVAGTALLRRRAGGGARRR